MLHVTDREIDERFEGMTGSRGKAAMAYLDAKNKKAEDSSKEQLDAKTLEILEKAREEAREVERKCENGELKGVLCAAGGKTRFDPSLLA